MSTKDLRLVPKVRPKQLVKILVRGFLKGRRFLITGAPGIGKTEIVKKAVELIRAAGQEINLIILHPVVSDPTDFKGLPAMVNGEAMFLPFTDLKKMMEANVLTVVFFDDLGQASQAVQAALMQLVLGREVNGKRISDHVVFVGATNRAEDRAGVSAILEPLKGRFNSIFELEPCPKEWDEWAEENDIDWRIRAYIMKRPEMLNNPQPSKNMVNAPNPRNWFSVDGIIKDGYEEDVFAPLTAGAIGSEVGQDFTAFYKIADRLINPKAVISSPHSAPLPKEVDQTYALVVSLATLASDENIDNIVEYWNRMDAVDEFVKLFWHVATRRDASLKETRGFLDFNMKHHKGHN